MKKLLKDIAFKLEAISASVAGLEAIAMSENYSGRQITKKQLDQFRREAKRDQKEVFDALKASIQALSTK